jgi:hypothetical protein
MAVNQEDSADGQKESLLRRLVPVSPSPGPKGVAFWRLIGEDVRI